jgi:hypothetical protein
MGPCQRCLGQVVAGSARATVALEARRAACRPSIGCAAGRGMYVTVSWLRKRETGVAMSCASERPRTGSWRRRHPPAVAAADLTIGERLKQLRPRIAAHVGAILVAVGSLRWTTCPPGQKVRRVVGPRPRGRLPPLSPGAGRYSSLPQTRPSCSRSRSRIRAIASAAGRLESNASRPGRRPVRVGRPRPGPVHRRVSHRAGYPYPSAPVHTRLTQTAAEPTRLLLPACRRSTRLARPRSTGNLPASSANASPAATSPRTGRSRARRNYASSTRSPAAPPAGRCRCCATSGSWSPCPAAAPTSARARKSRW